MKFTELFTKTRKEDLGDDISKNENLLTRGGFIHKEMAGVYTFLPLGLRVLNKIIEVIRIEMNKIGGQEISMTAIQDKSLWEKTGRWNDDVVDVWFKTKLKNGTEVGLGVTHEEVITRIMNSFVRSYRDLPKSVYQFQTKFRNETRAKSGIMRTREFIMKDLYSFNTNEESQLKYYEVVKNAYVNIFKALGLGDKTYVTFASGGIFSKYSHEFQTVCDAGEDEIYISDKLGIAINKEVMIDEVLNDLGVLRNELRVAKASEVGNIFNLGTRFSDALDLKYTDEQGQSHSVWMGSYGIGPARVMGVIVEALSDEKGVIWPKSVAPFTVHLVSLHENENDEVYKKSLEIYQKLTANHVEVLFDDRVGVRAGEKFADADLIGIPFRVVVSERNLKNNKIEIKERTKGESELIEEVELYKTFTPNCE